MSTDEEARRQRAKQAMDQFLANQDAQAATG